MTTSDATEKKPLWLLIEENILELDSQDLQGKTWKHRFNGLQVNLTMRVTMFRIMGAICFN